jgi:glutamine amidotransferase
MIAIIDYGMGNLRSVLKAFEHLGAECVVTSDAAIIQTSQGIVLPGVGAFPRAMKELRERGLISTIKEQANSGKPLLGICLGMQLLFGESEEIEVTEGLGLLPGRVRKIPAGRKIPHMGWNSLQKQKESVLLNGLEEAPYVYYVHSYYADCPEEVIDASSDYGVRVPGLVSKATILGAQFHPEKSGDAGLKMLENFKELVERCSYSRQLI